MPKQNVWVKAKEQTEAVHSSPESVILSTGAVEVLPADALQASYLILQKYWKVLPSKDHVFAKAMVAAYEKPNHGSGAQQHWLKVKADLAKKLAIVAGTYETPEGVEDEPDVQVEGIAGEKNEEAGEQFTGFEKVYALFQNAAGNGKLKHPKINLQLADGSGLMLYLAGKNSKKPGVINLTDGGPYPNNKWYGRIYPDGKWEQPKNYKAKVVDAKDVVHSALHELANDPVGVATKYGKLTGKCCFCKKTLTEDHSLGAGFGAVCATKYGLKGDWQKAINPLGETAKPKAINPAKPFQTLVAAMQKKMALDKEPEGLRAAAPKIGKKVDFLF